MVQIDVLFKALIDLDFFCLLFEHHDRHLGFCAMYLRHTRTPTPFIRVTWCELVKGEIINSYLSQHGCRCYFLC